MKQSQRDILPHKSNFGSVHTTRVHGRVNGPCQRAVLTGSVGRTFGRPTSRLSSVLWHTWFGDRSAVGLQNSAPNNYT